MTFAGAVIGCWLAIAGIAFLAISGLGRLAARGDVDSDLGIVGAAELRMLVGSPTDERRVFEAPHATRGTSAASGAHTVLAMSVGSGARIVGGGARIARDRPGWTVGDRSAHDYAGYTT
jgi:hypothetical protein